MTSIANANANETPSIPIPTPVIAYAIAIETAPIQQTDNRSAIVVYDDSQQQQESSLTSHQPPPQSEEFLDFEIDMNSPSVSSASIIPIVEGEIMPPKERNQLTRGVYGVVFLMLTIAGWLIFEFLVVRLVA